MGPLSLPRKISVLGSTGSVGVSTLDVLDQAEVEVEVVALAAGRNVERLAEQARRWRPEILSMATADAAGRLFDKLKDAGDRIKDAGGRLKHEA